MSVSITTLMVTFIFSITVNVLKMWDDSSGTLSAENQASLVFSYLNADLHSAVMRRDGNCWFLATVQNPQTANGNVGDAKMPNALWTATGSGAMKPNHDSPGQPGYSLALMPPSGQRDRGVSERRPGLYRPRLLREFTHAGRPPDRELPFRPGGNMVAVFRQHPRAERLRRGQRVGAPGGELPDRPGAAQRERFGPLPLRAVPIDGPAYLRPTTVNNAQTLSVFGSGYDLMAPVYNTPSNGTNTKAALEQVPVIRTPAIQQLLGNDVIDFGIRVWARVSDPGRGGGVGLGKDMFVLQFPNSSHNLGYAVTTVDGTGTVYTANNFGAGSPVYTDLVGNPLTNDGAVPAAGGGWTGSAQSMSYGFTVKTSDGTVLQATPAFVDVFLRVLDSDGVKLISNIESGLVIPAAERQSRGILVAGRDRALAGVSSAA